MEATSNGTAQTQTWRERVTAQQASGQSIRAWCREHNHHEHAFYWWRSRLRLSPKSVIKSRQPAEPLRFAEVVVNPAEPMCLRLGSGRELHLPASMPVEQIAALVRLLETTP
jgi:hypothetical protein